MSDKFEEWALLELMGHRRLAGWLTEATIGGASLIRIDVLDDDGETAATQFYSPSAVYCITPMTEDTAQAFAAHHRPEPVQRVEDVEAI